MIPHVGALLPHIGAFLSPVEAFQHHVGAFLQAVGAFLQAVVALLEAGQAQVGYLRYMTGRNVADSLSAEQHCMRNIVVQCSAVQSR